MAAVRHLLRATAGTLTWEPIDSTGEPADPGVVTVAVTDRDGSTLAGLPAVGGSGPAARTVAVTAAHTAKLGPLTAVWSASGIDVAVTTVEVVGGLWFSNAAVRSANEFKDAGEYQPALIVDARDRVVALIERITNRKFTPRYRTEIVRACGQIVLSEYHLRRVVSIDTLADDGSVASTASAETLAGIQPDAAGLIPGPWSGLLRVGYEYGADAPPADLAAAAIKLTREALAKARAGGLPENAVTISDGAITSLLRTPGVRGAHTIFPSVDEAIDGHVWPRPGVA